jgi:hypothetical protein
MTQERIASSDGFNNLRMNQASFPQKPSRDGPYCHINLVERGGLNALTRGVLPGRVVAWDDARDLVPDAAPDTPPGDTSPPAAPLAQPPPVPAPFQLIVPGPYSAPMSRRAAARFAASAGMASPLGLVHRPSIATQLIGLALLAIALGAVVAGVALRVRAAHGSAPAAVLSTDAVPTPTAAP